MKRRIRNKSCLCWRFLPPGISLNFLLYLVGQVYGAAAQATNQQAVLAQFIVGFAQCPSQFPVLTAQLFVVAPQHQRPPGHQPLDESHFSLLSYGLE